VELPGIEPGSSAAFPGLLRVQSAPPLLGSPGPADEPRWRSQSLFDVPSSLRDRGER